MKALVTCHPVTCHTKKETKNEPNLGEIETFAWTRVCVFVGFGVCVCERGVDTFLILAPLQMLVRLLF